MIARERFLRVEAKANRRSERFSKTTDVCSQTFKFYQQQHPYRDRAVSVKFSCGKYRV